MRRFSFYAFVFILSSLFLVFTPKSVRAQTCGSTTVTYTDCSDACRCPGGGLPCNCSGGCVTRTKTETCTWNAGSCTWSDYFNNSCSGGATQCVLGSGNPQGGYCSVACTPDGSCKGGGNCCSGSSYADGSCGSGIRCGTPAGGGGGGGGACPCSNWCTSSCPGGYTQTNYCGGNCSNGLVACIPSGSCGGGGGGGGGGGIPKKTCGEACTSDSDCNNPSAAGITTACRFVASAGQNQCVNLSCFNSGGQTIPGANCYCNGQRQCGDTCNPTVGVNCVNSACRYANTGGPNCPFGWGQTYCVPNSPVNGYSLAQCTSGDTGGKYLIGPGGVTSGMTPEQIASSCNCDTPPDSITGADMIVIGNDGISGTTVNAKALSPGYYENGNPAGQLTSYNTYRVTVQWLLVPGQTIFDLGGFGGGYEDQRGLTTYDIEIVPIGKDCSAYGAYCLYDTTIRYPTYSFFPKAAHYSWRVRKFNPGCNLAGPWTTWRDFSVTNLAPYNGSGPTGTVYLDDSLQASMVGGYCLRPGAITPPGWLEVLEGGYLGEYFNNPTIGGAALFSTTPRSRFEEAIMYRGNYDGGFGGQRGTQTASWAWRWTAHLRPTSTGTFCFNRAYSLYAPGTIGNRLYVGGQLIFDNWSGNVPFPSGCIALTAGVIYDFKYEVYDYSYVYDNYQPFGNGMMTWGFTDTSTPTTAGSGTTVTGSDSTGSLPPVTVQGNGQYTIPDVITNGQLQLAPGDTTYSCTCPAGCTYTGVNTPTSLKNFFVARIPPAWFQALGGNIVANGSIQSRAPSGLKPMLDGVGGFPGNALYGGNINLTGTNLSSKGWNGKTTYLGKTYDYTYFDSKIPGNVTVNNLGSVATQTDFNGGTISNGYYWFKANGNLTINSDVVISGNRKVILYVNGSLTINGKINIGTKGQGFFMAIVNGNVNVAGTVNNGANPAIEGIYVSNGTFDTGTGNTRLIVRGTVVAYGGMGLKRNLIAANSTTSAEEFDYAPDLLLLFPPDLTPSRLTWKEVIP